MPACRCAVCCSSDPRNQRTRTSALVRLDAGAQLLIDTSTDLRAQALKLSLQRIDAVLFTHAHSDHILGIEDLRGFNFAQGGAIPAYASPDTASAIRSMFHYVFNEDPAYEGGRPAQVTLHEIAHGSPFTLFGAEVMPLLVQHGTLEVTAFRIGKFAYLTDCNAVPASTVQALSGIEYLVLDGLRREPHKTHFTIDQAVNFAQAVGAKQTYLTHLTHSVDYAEESARLPAGVALAYDGLTFEVP